MAKIQPATPAFKTIFGGQLLAFTARGVGYSASQASTNAAAGGSFQHWDRSVFQRGLSDRLGGGTSGSVFRDRISGRLFDTAAAPSSMIDVAVKRFNPVSSDGVARDEVHVLLALPEAHDNIIVPVGYAESFPTTTTLSLAPSPTTQIPKLSPNNTKHRHVDTAAERAAAVLSWVPPLVVFPLFLDANNQRTSPCGKPPTITTVTRDVFSEPLPLLHRLTIVEALRALRQAALALSVLHARDIVHGDFYAHNIFLRTKPVVVTKKNDDTTAPAFGKSANNKRLNADVELRVSDFGASFFRAPLLCRNAEDDSNVVGGKAAAVSDLMLFSKRTDVRAFGIFALDVQSHLLESPSTAMKAATATAGGSTAAGGSHLSGAELPREVDALGDHGDDDAAPGGGDSPPAGAVASSPLAVEHRQRRALSRLIADCIGETVAARPTAQGVVERIDRMLV